MNANPHDAIDQNIDRALTALRDAQPRSGLNNRILASLEQRTATGATIPGAPSSRAALSRAKVGIARASAREVALWAATFAAILAIASLIVLHHHITPSQSPVILSEASHSNAQPKNPDTARNTTNAEPISTPNLAQTSSEPTHRMARRSASTTAAMPVRCAQGCPVHDDTVVMSGPAQTPTDAQLLADLHAPSHPAPPLALTHQEKLFLRMLRYGNATQIAELNPLIRAKQAADETAAFKAFFPDPPPLQQPGDTE